MWTVTLAALLVWLGPLACGSVEPAVPGGAAVQGSVGPVRAVLAAARAVGPGWRVSAALLAANSWKFKQGAAAGPAAGLARAAEGGGDGSTHGSPPGPREWADSPSRGGLPDQPGERAGAPGLASLLPTSAAVASGGDRPPNDHPSGGAAGRRTGADLAPPRCGPLRLGQSGDGLGRRARARSPAERSALAERATPLASTDRSPVASPEIGPGHRAIPRSRAWAF